MTITTVNPATGEVIKQWEEMTAQTVDRKIRTADTAFSGWRETDMQTRSELMYRSARILRENRQSYAHMMAGEMGKPVTDGLAEVDKCAWVCEYAADNAKHMLMRETIDTDARKSYVTFQPLGVILAIMPWNYPFWQVFRFAAPGLMAGNAAVLKHASNVCECAMALEDVFRQAGFPDGLFSAVLVSGRNVDPLIEHPKIRAVTLTGSTTAGQKVARKSGSVLKKTVLELGGSDPAIILDDADLDHAVEACVASRLLNSGQSCISAKRFIVTASIRRRFEEKFVAEIKQRKMGNPLDPDVNIGPQARSDLRENLHRQVEKSLQMGARCLTGGKISSGNGFFYPPTVLTNVEKGMPVFDEETFGPVAAIISVKDEKEAIQTANDTHYGLGASIFTRDLEKGERVAAFELEAGNCFVNAFVKSDPRLPFGGIKNSGFGRELSRYGILEFVNIKTVFIQ